MSRIRGERRPLLEREHELAELAAAVRDATQGAGCVVLISGEAGIGKSSLVEAARGVLPGNGRLLVGFCDDLATSRTLGPFRDLVGVVGTELTRALRDGGDRDRVLDAMYGELDWPQRPTILAIEDVHWADDASLDVLGYLARRIARLPAVLLLTYRDDELTTGHPLQRLLGLVAGAGRARRLPLSGLSEAGVRQLVGDRSVDARRLHVQTAGNPFFVTELLAAPASNQEVPRTVVDAVLARFARLDSATRHAVEQLAVIPSTVDRWLLDALAPEAVAALTVAEQRGLLEVSPNRVGFRHELTRRAVADSLPAARRAELNRRVLAVLAGRDDIDAARIVHHATEAGDRGAIARYALRAGRDAAESGAHRQAAAHFRLVLAQPVRFSPAELAELLEQYAAECSTIGDAQAAVEAQVNAVELRRTLGDRRRLGAALRRLSRIHWRNGDRSGNERAAAAAVAVLEGAGDPRLLAGALAHQAAVHMVGDRNPECIQVGVRAIALAQEVGDTATLAELLCSVGTSRWLLGDPAGPAMLEQSLRLAESSGAVDAALRTYGTLVWELLDHLLIHDAARHLDDGLALAERAEHLYYVTYLQLELGRLWFAQGRWDDAADVARSHLQAARPERCQALILLGRAQARRGEPSADDSLAQAWQLASELTELQHLAPAAAARAEAAWLRQDAAGVSAAIAPIYDDIRRRGVFAVQAEFAYWLTKAGAPEPPMLADNPYGLLATGRWREAADFWRAAGCRYEYAMALAESPDPADRLAALTELDGLGAGPLARIVRSGLGELGVTRIPRGPITATRANPAGLTGRQAQVLRLLGEGLTNAEIARRLVVSARTVDSHVAAVLAKLGARNRRDALARAAEIGLLEAKHP
jgi:DNA-binding CsgD family transcriptional regulator